jgi:hypothetical protein
MSSKQTTELILFIIVFSGGLYAGIGFFGFMGGNPAIKLMSNRTFAEYWQHTDHFMAARMKIYGPINLLLTLAGVIFLIRQYHSPAFWFMFLAFGILIVDVVLTISIHMPLNKLIQSWDLNNLPADVERIKLQLVNAFNRRFYFMIGSFLMLLLSLWFYRGKL